MPADSPPDSAANDEPEWDSTVHDLVAADRAGWLTYRCMGCGVRVGEDHELDCEALDA